MKVLFDVYCSASIHSAYLQSHLPPPDSQDEDSPHSINEPLAPPSGGICDSFKKLTLKAKNRAYQRFYQALTAHWVAVEFAWLVKIRVYPTTADLRRFSREIQRMWTDNRSRTLQEKLDIIEVADFVWVFLVRRIFHNPSCLLDWLDTTSSPLRPDGDSWLHLWLEGAVEDDQVDRIPELLCDPGFVQSYSVLFVDSLMEYLRPTHIVELLLLLTWNPQQSWKFDRFEYLCKLGFADAPYGWLRVHNGYRPDYLFPIGFLDDDVMYDLCSWGAIIQEERIEEEYGQGFSLPWETINKTDIDELCRIDWRGYRQGIQKQGWALHMRGQIFFREETPRELFNRIVGLPSWDFELPY
jgi:hypothetical protein